MKLFLSYASEYKIVAEEVALALRGAGYEVIFDQSWLKPGDDFHTKFRTVFVQIEGLIFLIAPESVRNGAYTLTELEFARKRWPHPANHVLPVMVAPTELLTVPPYLREVTFLEPKGNIAAEVADAVRGWKPIPSASAEEGVRVKVHLAAFVENPESPAYFVNVTNLFNDRDLEITHMWFDGPRPVDVMQSERQLPVRLRPYESWETWQYLDMLPDAIRHNAFTRARVRLSTGEIIQSTENIDVPERGFVPGGPISKQREQDRLDERKDFLQERQAVYRRLGLSLARIMNYDPPDPEWNPAKEKFYELYWGELPLFADKAVMKEVERFSDILYEAKTTQDKAAFANQVRAITEACRKSLEDAWKELKQAEEQSPYL